jgi:putative tricarboxylic transport membrane protein
MRKAGILTALGFVAFSIAVMVQAWQAGMGWREGQPQAGFFPFWLGLILAACGVVVLGQGLAASKEAVGAFFHDRTALTSVLKVSVTGVVMLALTYLAGFYAAAIVYLFVYTRFVGRHRWPAVIVMSLLIPIGSYILFERTLKILLPRGIFAVLPFLQ